MKTWTTAARCNWDGLDGLRSDCYVDGLHIGFVIRQRLSPLYGGGVGSVYAYRYEYPESVYPTPKFVAADKDFRTARRLLDRAAK